MRFDEFRKQLPPGYISTYDVFHLYLKFRRQRERECESLDTFTRLGADICVLDTQAPSQRIVISWL
jgi:hypothetical protein